jgi:NAD(P)-dependent dehydrogenase (short-subunit alcohol dehydrogenase family)
MSFANKTIILTGAFGGIRRALALSLAQQGANLVLAARNQAALEETVAACTLQPGSAIAIPTDVTQPKACQQLIEKAIATFGQIDSLINNAGISMVTRFDEITDLSIFEQVMQVNYLGAVYCTHYALPYLKASRGLLIEALRSNTLDTKRTVAAPKEAIPRTVKASADCNHKQVAPNPRKKLPSVERISETPIGAVG